MNKKKIFQITRDSCANVKILLKLERDGHIKIFDVMLENGRENTKVPEKILPVGVWDHARWGECVWGGEENEYKCIKSIIGDNNIEDAMHLEAHLRNGHDYFVTEDKDDILSKRNELKQIGIKVISPEELEKICENK